MTKQSPQLSALTLPGLPGTWLKRQYSLAFEPKNLFPLVADIYRRISLVTTKVNSFQANFKTKTNETFELLNDCKPANNFCFINVGPGHSLFLSSQIHRAL
jgi:hypothetical protein